MTLFDQVTLLMNDIQTTVWGTEPNQQLCQK